MSKCPKCGSEYYGVRADNYCLSCGYRGDKTVFHRITASPEMLAPKFVYHVTSFFDGLDKPKKIWYSTLINNQYFNTELEAKRATVAKLKEVAE